MSGLTKHQKLWLGTRREWLRLNPPNHQGYYVCYICKKWIPADEITIDHIIPRSRAPHLRYKLENLAPACWTCNTEKGSQVYEGDGFPQVVLDDILWY